MASVPVPRAAVILVVGAALLAGCGSSAVHAGGAPATTSPSPSSSGAVPTTPSIPHQGPGLGSLRRLPIISSQQTIGLTRMAGTLVSVSGGQQAVIRVQYGGCSGPPLGATVVEAASSVTVTPYDRMKTGQVCAAFVAATNVVVDLPTPLGARTLTVS